MNNKTFLFSSFVVSIMTTLSRIFGLIRDIIIAKYFGASSVLDAFLVAFKIPNFFRRLFAEGSFSQAVMPILADAKNNNKELEVINHISGRLLAILLIVTIIGIILSPIIIFIFAWGFYFENIDKFWLASDMLKITFPYLLLISVTAFFGSILNTNAKFNIPAFTPVLLNLAIILSAIFLAPQLERPIIALAWGVLLGGILQLLLQIPFLIKIKRLPKPTNKPHKVFKILKQRMLPVLFGTSVSQVNLLIDMMIASILVSGSISWLYYANRLLELPLAIIGVALGIVGLAKLSSLFVKNDEKNFTKTLNYSLSIGIIFATPMAIGLIFLAKPIIITLFQYDNFSGSDAYNSAFALMAYGTGLIFFVLIKIITPAFIARGNTKVPVKAGVIAMLSNIIFNIIFAYFYSYVGLAIATSISAVINFSILIFYLYYYNIWKLSKKFLQLIIKVIIASTIMLAVIIINNNYDYLTAILWDRIFMLIIDITSAILVYFFLLWILRVKINKLKL